jgi:hypothetical protein
LGLTSRTRCHSYGNISLTSRSGWSVSIRQPEAASKFEAKLPKVTEPGILKDRVDEAWQSIKYGLVAGASIGFRPLKDGFERMEDGGIKFKSVEVMELSAVTIPANQDCTISLVKSLDQKSLAAIGTKETRGHYSFEY